MYVLHIIMKNSATYPWPTLGPPLAHPWPTLGPPNNPAAEMHAPMGGRAASELQQGQRVL